MEEKKQIRKWLLSSDRTQSQTQIQLKCFRITPNSYS